MAKALSKAEHTRRMIAKELEKVGGDASQLDAVKIRSRLESNKSTDMTAGQARTYFRNYLPEALERFKASSKS